MDSTLKIEKPPLEAIWRQSDINKKMCVQHIIPNTYMVADSSCLP